MRFIRIPIIQNDIEVYERYCTYGDLEQNIPTLNKFSHGFIPTHISNTIQCGIVEFQTFSNTLWLPFPSFM
jgi:hypothetical protein